MPENEVANPFAEKVAERCSLEPKNLHKTERFCCPLVLRVHMCSTAACCHAPLSHQAPRCGSLSPAHKHTDHSQLYCLDFRLAHCLLTWWCIRTADSDCGPDPRTAYTSGLPARRWDTESSITLRKHRDVPRAGFGCGWAGRLVLIFVFLWSWFGLVGFIVVWCGFAIVILDKFWKMLKRWNELQSSQVPTSLCLQETIEYKWPCCLCLHLWNSPTDGDTEGLCVWKLLQNYFMYLFCRCLYN